MRIVVTQMPSSKSQCPMAEWKPFPPICEEPGEWVCTFAAKDKRNLPSCTLGEKEHVCRFLAQIPPQTNW